VFTPFKLLTKGAQINYTDLNPDVVLIGSKSAVFLDIDSNGIDDFAMYHDTLFSAWPNDSGMVNGFAHYNGNKVLCEVIGHMYPKSLYYSQSMGPQSAHWENFEQNVPLFHYCMVDGEYQNWGYFQNMTYDRYIGVEIIIDGKLHYGWIRIFIHPTATYLVCRDYAYNTTPGADIYAGEGIPTGKATNILAEDVSNLGNGKDLRLTFKKAEDEFTVRQYRIYVVKAEDSATFTIQTALSVSPGNLALINPNGNDYEFLFQETSKDIDGDLITENQEYLVYIVSYPAGTNSDDYQMEVSNPVILKNSSGISEINGDHHFVFYGNNNTYLNGTGKEVNFIIYDLSGKVLKSYKNISSTVQVHGLQKGVYILTVIENTSIRNYKMYIQE